MGDNPYDGVNEYDPEQLEHCDCASCQAVAERLRRLEQALEQTMRMRGNQDSYPYSAPAGASHLQPDGTGHPVRSRRELEAAQRQALPQHVQAQRARRRKIGRWNWVIRTSCQLFFYKHEHDTTVWRCFEFGNARLARLAQQAVLNHARQIKSDELHAWKFETHVDEQYGDLYVRKLRTPMQVEGERCDTYILPDTVGVDTMDLREISRN